MNNFEKIGQFIKKKREDKNLTQEELAKILGVSKPTVSMYESGERKPTFPRLQKIAEVLDTPVNELLSLDAPIVDIEIALRAEGIENDDIERIKNYIRFVKNASKAEQDKSEE